MRTLVIGGRTVVASCTVISKDDEIARLEVSIPEDQLAGADVLRLQFRFSDRNRAKPEVTWRTENEVVCFELVGWRYPGGSALDEAVTFGEMNREKLWLHVAHQTIGTANVAHILILKGGATDGH
jgi:hypothetical protein